MKVSVIMTCFNRKEKTKKCIEAILLSAKKSKYAPELTFFICDDGSTDGTSAMLQSLLAERAIIVNGTGNLYWAKGMAAAMEEAKKRRADFYWMVNDDVVFDENVVDIMLGNKMKYDSQAIIVGATTDDCTHEMTYGGYIWNGKALRKSIKSVLPTAKDLLCNTANWNSVLIPVDVYASIGDIDGNYEHSFADFDYSNRATSKGYKMYVADEYVGTCRRNETVGTWRDKSLPLKKRVMLLHKPNGFPPKSSWRYARKYYGIAAPVVFLIPYVSIIKDSVFRKRAE